MMSEEQNNPVLSTENVDIAGITKQDTNGESVMSKSKARSLRRKRAKQRKKATENQQENTESQDKENQNTPNVEETENQVAKKKKKPRKKKKAKVGEQPTAENKTETLDVIGSSKIVTNGVENLDNSSTETQIVSTSTEVLTNTTSTPKDDSNTKTKIEEPQPENTNEVVDNLVTVLTQRTVGDQSNRTAAPTSVYVDDNEDKKQTKEDCACACIIS